MTTLGGNGPCDQPLAAARPWAGPALGAYLLLTLLAYLPLMRWSHEEARRAIVAQEMLLGGDWAAPTIYQRPYYKKPPFHNWLIALSAGPDGVVAPAGARLVSIVAFGLTGAAVFWLARPLGRRRALLGLAATLTNYLVLCEYASLAEPDAVLTLVTFLAYAAWIRGPAHPGWLALSAALMGMGILTKGVSPLFFYPGALLATALRRERRHGSLLLVHALLALVLPGLWAAALAARGSWGELVSTAGAEVVDKAAGTVGAFLGHLVTYPARMFMVLLPWSLLALLGFRRPGGSSATLLRRSSALAALVALAVFTLAAASRDRYLLPAIPFLGLVMAHYVDPDRLLPRPSTVGLFGVLAVAGLVGAGWIGLKGLFLQAAVLAAAGSVATVLAFRRHRLLEGGALVGALMLTLYAHGVYYERTVRLVPSAPAARQIAAAVARDPGLPVVVEAQVDLIHVAVDLEGLLRRPVHDRAIAQFGRFYLLTNSRFPEPGAREILRIPYPRGDVREIWLLEVGPQGNVPP